MNEFSDGATRESAPPSPPRWRGIQSLDLVHQLNERCIELLCDVAAADARHTILQIVTENRELWLRLEIEARRRVARMPFVIVDAKFKDAAWWRRVAESRTHEARAEEPSNGLPREASEHLMHETAMFAWQTARWDRTVAQMSLAMSPSVADVIAALTPQQVRAIAARESQCIRVRWADAPRFWRDLLMTAKAGDVEKLAELHLHAKLLV
ncbi:MAG: hypothetical protein ACREXP_24145, partial [Steroidobacteraceae bacterium]